MSWDQPEFSFDNGQPPTPSQTPTSPPSFGDLFQTPRLDGTFYNPGSNWQNPESSNNYADILKTPRALLFSTSTAASPAIGSKPLQNERQGLGPTLVSNAEKLLSTPSFEGLQSDPSPQFGHSPMFGGKNAQPSSSHNDLALNASFHSASSIQTPPPTNVSATKRRGQQSENRPQPPKTANDRRLSVPIAPRPTLQTPSNSQIEPSAQNSGGLNFSPSVFGYDFSPQTAPAYPQAKLLWGDDNNINSNFDFLSQTPGLFGTPRQSQTDPFGFSTEMSSGNLPQQSGNEQPPQLPSQVNQTSFDPTTFAAGPSSSQKSRHGQRPHSVAVNPSLLFSSPNTLIGKAEKIGPVHRVLSEESLQPYAYQMQEAKREKGTLGNTKIKKRRKPSVDSPAVQAALENLRDEGVQRPPFQRSFTDGALPAPNRAVSAAAAAASMQRRSSPLKRNRDAARKNKQRTSLALTIDENGRARTETRVVEDSDGSDDDGMDVDRRSDDSSSSSSDDESDMIALPKTAMPRLGRFNNSATHSKKSSYTSLYSSTSYQDDPKLPEPRDRPSTSGTAHGRGFGGRPLQPLKETSFGSNDGRTMIDATMDSDGDDRNAQSELRKMAQRRQSGLRSAPIHSGGAFGELHENALSNISPTTLTDPDLATPTSAQSTASGGIRCVCNVAIDDGQMIQCESCRNWLHVPCTGLQPTRLPQIYLCLFCTGSTPIARGGRLRDPVRQGFMAPASPLAHKTARFR